MSTKDEFVSKMQTKLDHWNAEIDALVAKADQAGAESRAEYHKQIDELRSKRDQARQKMDTLKQAGEDAWADMKSGVESAWDAVGDAVDSMKSRFK